MKFIYRSDIRGAFGFFFISCTCCCCVFVHFIWVYFFVFAARKEEEKKQRRSGKCTHATHRRFPHHTAALTLMCRRYIPKLTKKNCWTQKSVRVKKKNAAQKIVKFPCRDAQQHIKTRAFTRTHTYILMCADRSKR